MRRLRHETRRWLFLSSLYSYADVLHNGILESLLLLPRLPSSNSNQTITVPKLMIIRSFVAIMHNAIQIYTALSFTCLSALTAGATARLDHGGGQLVLEECYSLGFSRGRVAMLRGLLLHFCEIFLHGSLLFFLLLAV